MKKFIFLALGLMATGLVFAQEAKSVEDMLDEWMQEKGLHKGLNKKNDGTEFYVAVGQSIILAPQSKPFSYINSRVNAFDKAMLNAEQKIATYLAGRFKSEIENGWQQGKFPTPLESLQDTVGNAVKAVGFEPETLKTFARNMVNHLLESNGISSSVADPILSATLNDTPNDPELARKLAERKVAADKILQSQEFKKVMECLARSKCMGVQVAYSCEGPDDADKKDSKQAIGVVVIWSEKHQEMAASLLSGRAVAKKTAKRPIREQIPTDKHKLLRMFGVQQMIDESGNLVLVSFGQAGGQSESSMSGEFARDMAYANAVTAIREFAGKNMAVASETLRAESATEYINSMEDYKDQTATRKKITAVAEEKGISGISEIKSWRCKHPLTGTTVYGVVCTWSPKQADAARRMKETMENPTVYAPSSAPAATTSTTSTTPEPTASSFSGGGQGCDLDAF